MQHLLPSPSCITRIKGDRIMPTGWHNPTVTWSHYNDVIMGAMVHQITSLNALSKKTSKPRVTGLCVGNSPVTGEFPAQRVSNAENVSIWWHHHALTDIIWWCTLIWPLHCLPLWKVTYLLFDCLVNPLSGKWKPAHCIFYRVVLTLWLESGWGVEGQAEITILRQPILLSNVWLEKGCCFFVQNPRKGGVFQAWVRGWFTFWSGVGVGGIKGKYM